MDKPLVALAILGIALIMVGLIVAISCLALLGTGVQTAGYSYLWSVGGKSFSITLVESNSTSWERGLMNSSITNSTIMIFVFPKSSVYPFWMYDTYSNLDMIWLNVSGGAGEGGIGKVVYIQRNATSCFDRNECAIYTPSALANYVIEAKAGFAYRNGINTGDNFTLTKVAR